MANEDSRKNGVFAGALAVAGVGVVAAGGTYLYKSGKLDDLVKKVGSAIKKSDVNLENAKDVVDNSKASGQIPKLLNAPPSTTDNVAKEIIKTNPKFSSSEAIKGEANNVIALPGPVNPVKKTLETPESLGMKNRTTYNINGAEMGHDILPQGLLNNYVKQAQTGTGAKTAEELRKARVESGSIGHNMFVNMTKKYFKAHGASALDPQEQMASLMSKDLYKEAIKAGALEVSDSGVTSINERKLQAIFGQEKFQNAENVFNFTKFKNGTGKFTNPNFDPSQPITNKNKQVTRLKHIGHTSEMKKNMEGASIEEDMINLYNGVMNLYKS